MAGTASYVNPPISADYRTTVYDLLSVLPDNAANLIDAKDVRDSVWTLWNRLEDVQITASASLSSNTNYVRSAAMQIAVGGAAIGTTFSGTIQDALDKILYPYVSQSNSLSPSGASRQFGSTTAVTLTWGVTKNSNTITSITVDGTSVTPTGNSQTGTKSTTATHSLVPTAVSESQSYSMSTNDGTTTKTTSAAVTWMSKRYWGYIDLTTCVPSNPDLTLVPGNSNAVGSFITDTKIKALTGAGVGSGSELATSLSKSYANMNAAGKYLCFAWPTLFGTPTFVVNGLTNTAFTKVRGSSYLNTFSNEYGFTGVKYDVWISNTAYNSAATIVIS
jgi:hypothetical protein